MRNIPADQQRLLHIESWQEQIGLKLFIANKNYSSWSLRPWLLLRMLDAGFEEVLVPFAGSGPQQAFLDFSPSGKVPCLQIDGHTVWDSLAIIETLAERYPAAWPGDFAARAWARSASAEMHSGFFAIRRECSMSCGQRIRLNTASTALDAEWQRAARLWADGLERFGGPYLAGAQFTAVDAMFAPFAFRAQTYNPALPAHAAAYLERLLALPQMAEWYTAALREPFRDADHEREMQAAGTVVEDLRSTA